MIYRLLVAACLIGGMVAVPAAGIGQDGKATEASKAAAPAQEQPKPDPKIEEYEKAIKDLKKYEGAFTFYTRKKDILLELPESKLGQTFFFQATLNTGAGGGAQAGDPLGMFSVDALRWEKRDEQVWIVRPNFRFRWNPDDPLAVASQRSFPEAVLGGFRIEQTHPAKKLLLVNVTNLFYGDLVRLQEAVNMGIGGQYSLDREKSGLDSLKSFGQNTIVRMAMYYTMQRSGGPENPFLAMLGMGGNFLEDPRSAPLKVTYNLWYREESDYRPRIADPRVGYFTEDFYSVSRFLEADRTQRYIMRYHLKKKDPSAQLSEPVKPIVWYIDPSVPKAYRDAVRDGILAWNKAFEEIGYKDALVVKDAPENDPDWDHADGRFNVVRWTMSPDAGYAVALFRTDPFTGEVLNAAVTFDANMLFFAQMEQERFAVPASSAMRLAEEALLRHPTDPLMPVRRMWGEVDPEREAVKARASQLGWRFADCSLCRDLKPYLRMTWHAIEAAGIGISKEQYAKQFIRETTMHEIGHCLGLRHNFVASTNLTTAQMADLDTVNAVGVTASVMDYNPPNVQAVFKSGLPFYSPVIGPYDKWAIRYGYMDVAANSPEGEKFALSQVARQSGVNGHAFMTDEDADSFNPFVARFDNAKDPLNYSERIIEALTNIRKYAIKNLPKPGEDYEKRTTMILSSYAMLFRQARLASRFVGGIATNRSFRGDIGAAPTVQPVDPALQWQALSLITRKCLSLAAVDVPENVLLSLSRSYNSAEGSSWTAPLRSYLSSQQIMLYATLMSAATLDRVIENQFKWGRKPNAYTLSGHMGAIIAAVFEEVGQNRPISPVRRDLQRFAVNALITQCTAPPGAISDDVRMLGTDALKRLRARAQAQLARREKLDAMTVAHLTDMRDGIDRCLKRQMTGAR